MKVQFKTLTFIVFLCAASSVSASANMKTAHMDTKTKAETEREPLNARTQPALGAAAISSARYKQGFNSQPMERTPATMRNDMKALYAVSFAKAQQKAKENAAAPTNSTASAAAPAAAAAPVAAAPKKAVTKRSCMVCMDDKKDERFIKLSCGHDLTCFRCLKAMLMNVFKEKTTAQFKCPEVKCKKELSLADVKALTATVAKWNAFDSIVLKEFLAKNPLIKHCPTPKCSVMYELPDLDPQMRETVKCEKCKKSYCSHCQSLHSDKMTCTEAKENLSLGSDKAKAEKATEELIKKTTKACPQCKKPIEKNDGCNHMTCAQCHHEFCWVCLKDYRNKVTFQTHVCDDEGDFFEDDVLDDDFAGDLGDGHPFDLTITDLGGENAHSQQFNALIGLIEEGLIAANFNPNLPVTLSITATHYTATQQDGIVSRRLTATR